VADAIAFDAVEDPGERFAALDGYTSRLPLFSKPARLAKAWMAARCRRSESPSTPTLAAELVRRYATAGVRILAMHYAAKPPASLSSAVSGPMKLPR
jgi:hypothetical protein